MKITALVLCSLFILARLSFADAVAGAVVTSKEWQVKRGKDSIETFIGDVRYHTQKNEILAKWARFFHATQKWFLKGDVRATRTEDTGDILKVFGDIASYNQNTQSGWIRPAKHRGKSQILIIRQPLIGPPDHATADWAKWTGNSKTILIGHVHSKGPRLESWSDKTTILEGPGKKAGCSLRRVILTGSRPVAVKFPQDPKDWHGAVKGDLLKTRNPHPSNQDSAANSNSDVCGQDRFTALGHARGWIVFRKTSHQKSKAQKKK